MLVAVIVLDGKQRWRSLRYEICKTTENVNVSTLGISPTADNNMVKFHARKLLVPNSFHKTDKLVCFFVSFGVFGLFVCLVGVFFGGGEVEGGGGGT